jgi:hypothetical protein
MPLAAARRAHSGDLQVRDWQAQRNVMNDTVATEDQEQPASAHERKARIIDRDPGRRTASRPAEICSALKAGHMTAADQIVQNEKSACHEVVHIWAVGCRPNRFVLNDRTLMLSADNIGKELYRAANDRESR